MKNEQLTKNFSRVEFDCKDGTPVPTKYMENCKKVAQNLQVLRDHIGEPVHVSGSGYRTPSHNAKVGGAPASQHLKANGADITAKSYTSKKLAAVIEKLIKEGKMEQGGIGIYPGFVHYDRRGTKARW